VQQGPVASLMLGDLWKGREVFPDPAVIEPAG